MYSNLRSKPSVGRTRRTRIFSYLMSVPSRSLVGARVAVQHPATAALIGCVGTVLSIDHALRPLANVLIESHPHAATSATRQVQVQVELLLLV